MEVGVGPGDFVLDGTLLHLPKKGAESPQFSAHFYCGQTAGCIKMPLGIDVALSQGDCVRSGTRLPQEKGHSAPPNFWPMSIVAKRLDGSRCYLVRR